MLTMTLLFQSKTPADSDDEDDSDDDGGAAVDDSFLADDGEDDAEEDGDGADAPADPDSAARRERRRRKRRRQALRLDDDDYDLLEENQVPGVRRPAPEARRRIRKKGEVAGGAGEAGAAGGSAWPPAAAPVAPARAGGAVLTDDEESDEDAPALASDVAPPPSAPVEEAAPAAVAEPVRAPPSPPAAEETTAAQPAEAEPSAAPPAAPANSDIFKSDSSSEEDEMADFIASEDELDEDALAAMAPEERDAYRRQKRAQRKARRAAGGAGGGAMGAVAADLADIFGDEEELEGLLAQYAQAGTGAGAGVDGGEPSDEGEDGDRALRAEDFEGDAEAWQAYMAERTSRVRARAAARVAATVEPGALERHMLRPEDDAARAADVPERLQEAGHRPPPGLGDAVLDAATAWVVSRLFGGSAPDSLARDLVVDGQREVDGPPPDGRGAYDAGELCGGATLLPLGRRGVTARREGDARRAWRKSDPDRARLAAGVRAALAGLWADRMEVPFLAAHAKGSLADLLAHREADLPALTPARESEARLASGRPPFPAGTVQAAGRRLRRLDVLWAVADAAGEWANLARRKAARAGAYGRVLADPASSPAERDAAAEAAAALADADTADEIADVDARFELARAAAALAGVAGLSLSGEDADAPAPPVEGAPIAAPGAAAAGAAPSATSPPPPPEGGDKAGVGADACAAAPVEEEEEAPLPAPTPARTPQPRRRRPSAGLRRPTRVTTYATCKRAGLDPLVAALGLSAAAMAENAVRGYPVTAPAPAEGLPDDLAASVAASLPPPFSNPEAALRGARATLAAELAAEPDLRRAVRKEFDRRATVSTAPTPRGDLSERLDPFHPYGRVRRLGDKPLRDCEGSDLFLRIDAAARAGLVTVTVALPPDQHASLVGEFAAANAAGNAADPVGSAWDEQRAAVVADAVSLILKAVGDAASRAALAAARAVAAREYGDALWRLATRAPVEVRPPDDEDGATPVRPRFVAGSHGPGAPATAFVALDERGALVEVLYCAHLSGRVRPPPRPRTGPGGVPLPTSYSPLSDGRAAPDARALRTFIMAHAPHAVLVGCSGPDGRALRDVVGGVRDHILEHDPQFLTRHETGDVGVRLVDERVADLWAGSAEGAAELPDAPASVRRAVAVGRLGLDPLAVFASLAGRGRELASLSLTELQDDLGPDAVLAAARRVLVTAVNQVGVDLNAAAACPWRAAPLAYVAGLGPRKAGALLKGVAGLGGRAPSRAALAGGPAGLGPIVWRNAASFLRVCRLDAPGGGDGYESDEEGATNPLDDSRVHPEAYKAALAVAVAALRGSDKLPRQRRRRRRHRHRHRGSDSDGDGAGPDSGTDEEWERAVLTRLVTARPPGDVEAVDLAVVAARLAEKDRHKGGAGGEGGGGGGGEAGAPPAPPPVMSTDAPAADAGDGDGTPLFEAAPAFAGARDGFVFGAGPAGVGYYRDRAPAPAAGPPGGDGEGGEEDPPPPPLPPSDLALALPPLVDASFELIAPAGELRLDVPPTAADEFWLATGQRPDTLRPGLPVDLVIRWAGPHEARGTLPAAGGVEAVIPADAISSSGGGAHGAPVDPRDYFRPGDIVAARILDLQPDACEVRCGTASSILNDADTWEETYCRLEEAHYLPLTAGERAAIAARAAGGGAARRAAALVKRPIAHPLYDNVTEAEAVARLALPEASVGDALVRPHPSGPHKLRLSVKLHHGAHGPIILHRDVLEAGKARKANGGAAGAAGGGGHLALGLPLTVGLGAAGLKSTYDDLDELLARHAEPLASTAAALAAHRKFVDDDDWDRVRATLSADFERGGRRSAAYCLCPVYTRPGTYFIGFVLPTQRATPHREYLALTPDGIYYRSGVHANIERALGAFKADPTNRKGEAAAAAAAGSAVTATGEYWNAAAGGGGGGATGYGAGYGPGGATPGQDMGGGGGGVYDGWGAQAPPPPPPPPAMGYGQAQQGYGGGY